MAFQCSPAMMEQEAIERTNSAFGDGYSVNDRSRSSGGGSFRAMQRYHDEPEADYDEGATDLYRRIENKDWDGALSRLEKYPVEAKTWVSRREYHSDKTRWRLLPLHAVCIFRAPLALIEALIEVYPDGPQMKDDQGMLPVHLACRNGASKGVVLTLLASFPESIHVRDRKGRSPTDLVMTSSSQNKEAVLYALKRFRRDSMDDEAVDYPTNKMAVKTTMLESTKSKKKLSSPLPVVATIQKVTSPVAKEVDYEHRTVLFRLILKKEWTAAVTRAQAFPEEASTWIVTKGFNGNLRFLPLHKACVLQPPVSVIHALLEAYPKGCAEADQDEWLPLHCAAFYGTNDEVINALLNAYPKGAQIKDSDDRLPLHYACLKGASLGVVQTLLESFPKGTMSKDNEGRLPLHQAAGKNAPDDVIDALLKACPKAAQSKDDTSRLALHHACRKNASERTVRTLIKVYPRAAQIKDDQDKLPIHYACQHATVTSDKVVALLLATHPESVNVQNGFGYTPLAEIKAHDNPKLEHVVRRLEKTKRDQDKKKTVNENGAVEGQVALLQDRVRDLERSMAKIASLGREVQKDLLKKNKTPADIIEKFADRLVEIGTKGSGGGGATPLKVRQATPSKGLFNRVSKGIMSNGKM